MCILRLVGTEDPEKRSRTLESLTSRKQNKTQQNYCLFLPTLLILLSPILFISFLSFFSIFLYPINNGGRYCYSRIHPVNKLNWASTIFSNLKQGMRLGGNVLCPESWEGWVTALCFHYLPSVLGAIIRLLLSLTFQKPQVQALNSSFHIQSIWGAVRILQLLRFRFPLSINRYVLATADMRTSDFT